MKDTPLRVPEGHSPLQYDHKEKQVYDRYSDLFIPIEEEKHLPPMTQEHLRQIRDTSSK